MNNYLFTIKYRFFFSLVFIAFLAGSLPAQTKGFGIGLAFGEPTGICFKNWIDEEHAITGAVAYSIIDQSNLFGVNVNYTWNRMKTVGYKTRLGFQYGAGLGITTRKNISSLAAIRITTAAIWYPNFIPIDFYFEFAPEIVVYPYSGIGLDAGAGIRYYFKSAQN